MLEDITAGIMILAITISVGLLIAVVAAIIKDRKFERNRARVWFN